MSTIVFTSPGLLALLVGVPVLAWLAVRDARRRALRMAVLADAVLMPAVAVGEAPQRRMVARGAAIVGYALLVVAAAGPQWGGKTVLLPQKGLDIVFVLDVSRSMRARDVLPDRLERAKAEIGAVLDRLGEHRVALVAFAGTAFLQCPLTADKEALRMFLRDLSPDSLPEGGTDIAAGLQVAMNAIHAEGEATGNTKSAGKSPGHVVVVVTDGEDHEGGLAEIAKDLKEQQATVFFLGTGSALGEPIPVLAEDGTVSGYLKDRAGHTVMTRMDPAALAQVATDVGGTFIDGSTRPDLGFADVEAKINTLEKRDLASRVQIERDDQTVVFAAPALALCLLALLVPHGRRARRRAVEQGGVP